MKDEMRKSFLKTAWAGSRIHCFAQVDSTNNKAKELAKAGALHGTLVLAEQQTQGKGRSGKNWTTTPGEAVAMTLIVRPEVSPEKASMLTLVMGMAVAAACRHLLNLPVQIKWPNDVVIHGKKVCGILTEMKTELHAIHYLVIGVGINVNMNSFSEEIKDVATSLMLETGHSVNRKKLIGCCLRYFEEYYKIFEQTGDFSQLQYLYQELLVNLNAPVRVLEPGNEYSGISRGINEKGELLVEKEDKSVVAVFAGEVSVRGVYGYV